MRAHRAAGSEPIGRFSIVRLLGHTRLHDPRRRGASWLPPGRLHESNTRGADAGGVGGMVVVGSGLFYEHLPVGGRSIAQVREQFADRLDIDPAATPVIDGNPVRDEDTVLRAGQMLTFFQYAGRRRVLAYLATTG